MSSTRIHPNTETLGLVQKIQQIILNNKHLCSIVFQDIYFIVNT